MAKLRLFTLFSLILVFCAGCAGLGRRVSTMTMLIGLGMNDGAKEQTLRQETRNYQRVREYIDNDKMKKGISVKSAMKKFGEPILVFSESYGEKWVYKSSGADWLGGEQIYLFFDDEGYLTNWECVNCSY